MLTAIIGPHSFTSPKERGALFNYVRFIHQTASKRPIFFRSYWSCMPSTLIPKILGMLHSSAPHQPPQQESSPHQTVTQPTSSYFPKRTCKIMQESCMQDLLGTYVPFLARFLHNLAPILAKECANLQVIILVASLPKSCTISCKICARLCKNHARKGTYRVHLPSKSCTQDSCTILHDLASSGL